MADTRAIAQRMLAKGLSVALMAEVTELPEEEIRQFVREMRSNKVLERSQN